jgi:hypothetical protein
LLAARRLAYAPGIATSSKADRGRDEGQEATGVAAPLPAAAGSLERTLLALQREHGNAAVGRMLAKRSALRWRLLRQPLPAEDEPTGPGPRRIDRHDVLIGTARGPILHDHGGFEWYATFSLPFAAEADGFIIQELYQESSGGRAGEHFWECWRVRANAREPADRVDGYDDRYRQLNVPGAAQPASGWKRHVGVIRFYPGPLPAEFGPDRSGVDFYLTRTRPSVWTGSGTRHDCYSEWDTRTGVNGLVAYAGTQELRVGSSVTFRPRD